MILNGTAQKSRRNQLSILKERIAFDSEFTSKNQKSIQILNTLRSGSAETSASKIHWELVDDDSCTCRHTSKISGRYRFKCSNIGNPSSIKTNERIYKGRQTIYI